MPRLRTTRKFFASLMIWMSALGLCANPVLAAEIACGCAEADVNQVGKECCQSNNRIGAETESRCCKQSTESCCSTVKADNCCATQSLIQKQPSCQFCSAANQANDCQCMECHCSVGNNSHPVPPALPVEFNQYSPYIVAVSAVSFDVNPAFCFASSWPVVGNDHSFSSALSTCALLSRFTC